MKPSTSLTRRSTSSPLRQRPEASKSFRWEGAAKPAPQLIRQRRYERAREISNAYENHGTGHGCVKRTGRTGRPFAVLLLDLDQLKKINDRYGHLIGSQALCRLADVLRVFCRSIDTATRYGGDEFAVILPETMAAAARLVALRIRSRLAADSLQPTLSASIGVAVYPEDGETIEALLRTADRELYAMKPV